MRKILHGIIGLQGLCWLLFIFGDIGFDHPGKYGLDYAHFLIILWAYVALLLSGVVLAIRKRRWGALATQGVPLLCFLVYVLAPLPKYDASKYQNLLGMSRKDVEHRLGHPRGEQAGAVSDERHRNEEFLSLRGMTIFFSRENVVVSVERNDR